MKKLQKCLKKSVFFVSNKRREIYGKTKAKSNFAEICPQIDDKNVLFSAIHTVRMRNWASHTIAFKVEYGETR